jgi:hypothetical protein
MPARAEGFRAIPSVAEAAARPWPSPQPAEAIAIETPAKTATQLVAAGVPPWAKAGTAKHNADKLMNTLLNVPIVFSPMKCRQWVVDVTVQTSSR